MGTKAILTADEACKYMGIAKSYLYKLTSARKIPYSKPLGKMCYFRLSDIENFLQSNPIATAKELEAKAEGYNVELAKKGGCK